MGFVVEPNLMVLFSSLGIVCVCVCIATAYFKKRWRGKQAQETENQATELFRGQRDFVKHSRRLTGQPDSLASLLVCSSWLGKLPKYSVWGSRSLSSCGTCKGKKFRSEALTFSCLLLIQQMTCWLKMESRDLPGLESCGATDMTKWYVGWSKLGCISVPVGISQRVMVEPHAPLHTPFPCWPFTSQSLTQKSVPISNAVEFVFLGVFLLYWIIAVKYVWLHVCGAWLCLMAKHEKVNYWRRKTKGKRKWKTVKKINVNLNLNSDSLGRKKEVSALVLMIPAYMENTSVWVIPFCGGWQKSRTD